MVDQTPGVVRRQGTFELLKPPRVELYGIGVVRVGREGREGRKGLQIGGVHVQSFVQVLGGAEIVVETQGAVDDGEYFHGVAFAIEVGHVHAGRSVQSVVVAAAGGWVQWNADACFQTQHHQHVPNIHVPATVPLPLCFKGTKDQSQQGRGVGCDGGFETRSNRAGKGEEGAFRGFGIVHEDGCKGLCEIEAFCITQAQTMQVGEQLDVEGTGVVVVVFRVDQFFDFVVQHGVEIGVASARLVVGSLSMGGGQCASALVVGSLSMGGGQCLGGELLSGGQGGLCHQLLHQGFSFAFVPLPLPFVGAWCDGRPFVVFGLPLPPMLYIFDDPHRGFPIVVVCQLFQCFGLYFWALRPCHCLQGVLDVALLLLPLQSF